MNKLMTALVALLILAGGAALVVRYRLSHRPRPALYAPITAGDELAMANVACGSATGLDARQAITCSICPKGSDFADPHSMPGQTGWTADGTLPGHFTAAKADEALLHVAGCESHARNFGGDFLMTRTSGVWSVVRYAPGGTANDRCQKITWQQDRDAIICENTDIGQGVAFDAVQLLLFDAIPPPADNFANATFVAVTDETGNCGFQQPHNGPEALMQFGKIDSAKLTEGEDGNPYLAVAASIERVRSVTTKPGVCPAGHRRTYHVAFHTMGDHFEATDGYEELALQKRDDCCTITINKTVRPGRY